MALTHADADLWDQLAELIERGARRPSHLSDPENFRIDALERARRLRDAATGLREKLLLGRYVARRARFRARAAE